MDNLTLLDKNILVERHLISREHAESDGARAVIISVRPSGDGAAQYSLA